jgi:endonuclease YncB( thermonuclease family)
MTVRNYVPHDVPHDADGMNRWIDTLVARCPHTVGEKVARLTRDAEQTVGRAEDTLGERRVEVILDGERLRVEGLGEVRLAGVTVPPERQAAAKAYLIRTIEGKALRIAATNELDPNRRPLVLVTLKDGTLLNAPLIQERLATPWKRPALWHTWPRQPLSDSP